MRDPTQSVLDMRRVDELRSLASPEMPDLHLTVVRLFLETTGIAIANVVLAAEQGDAALLQEEAHRARGSCGNVGALRLAEHLDVLEQAGRRGETPTDRLHALRAEFELVAQALRKEFVL